MSFLLNFRMIVPSVILEYSSIVFFPPDYPSWKEYLDAFCISTDKIRSSPWSCLLGFVCHIVSQEISGKKVHALVSKLGVSTVACILSLEEKRMLAHRPHHHKSFLGQKLKYQTFSFKNQTPVYPVLECN